MKGQATCRWCSQGHGRVMLDADGTLSAVSGRPGIWGHTANDYFWPCETDYPLPARMERYRDPFELLRDSERGER